MAIPNQTNILITGSHGERIDKHLALKLTGISRTQIQKLIEAGSILVNNRPVSKHHFLKTGDKIRVFFNKDQIKPGQIDKKLPKASILAATADYLIVNKPSGLVVHPDSKHPFGQSLIGQIVKSYPEVKAIGADSRRPGVVHRLDKEVSGVMLVARNQRFFDHIKSQFKSRLVNKEYLALVHGRVKKESDRIELTIDRKKSGSMAAKPMGSPGRAALTEINLIKTYNKHSLLKVFPKTGRTHQIRVHLLSYGHPIVGDRLYCSKQNRTDKLGNTIDRIFLHSRQLSFFDFSGEYQQYSVNLSKKLKQILDSLS